MVEYLMRRRCPGLAVVPLSRQLRKFADQTSQPPSLKAGLAFRAKLEAIAPSELQSLYNVERANEVEESREKSEAEEAARSWNQPYVRTEYDFWSKAAIWTLDEATALTLGRDPHHVTWEKLRTTTTISAFARKYERQRDLILRAKGIGQLYDPALPGFFLAWAKRTGIELDPKLVEVVEARGVQVADWKTKYDEMLKIAQSNKSIGEDALRRAAELEAQLEAQRPPSKRERAEHAGTEYTVEDHTGCGSRLL
ncbi:MAG: hypothetical protein ACRED5_12010 [Propylenella sp.]